MLFSPWFAFTLSALYSLSAVAAASRQPLAARMLEPRRDTPPPAKQDHAWRDDDAENYCEYQSLRVLGVPLVNTVRVRLTMDYMKTGGRECPQTLGEDVAIECNPTGRLGLGGQSHFTKLTQFPRELMTLNAFLASPSSWRSDRCDYEVLLRKITDKTCIERVLNCLRREGTRPVHCVSSFRDRLERVFWGVSVG